MSQLNSALTANAHKNRQLLSELAATDYASPSLKQNMDFINDLKRQIASTDKELTHLHAITEDERKVCSVSNTPKTKPPRHDRAQSDLDTLYNSMFSGPTPDVPGEDQLEEAVKQNRAHFHQVQTQISHDKQALNALMCAETSLVAAHQNIQSALSHSKRDMYGGGGFVDMMERDALASAQNNVHGAIRHLEEARRRQPQI